MEVPIANVAYEGRVDSRLLQQQHIWSSNNHKLVYAVGVELGALGGAGGHQTLPGGTFLPTWTGDSESATERTRGWSFLSRRGASKGSRGGGR